MKGQNEMNELLEKLMIRPKLYEQSEANIWSDPHISKGMLKAHLNEDLESATRKLDFVRKSATWISQKLPPHQYHNLVDLGCGPGIYTELFYQQGYQVTGIDLSKRSIEYAKNTAVKKDLIINYLHGDYTVYPFSNHYDLATLIYCDFGVFPTAVRRQLLTKIYNLLSDNGALLFDVFTPLKYLNLEEHKD